MYNQYFVMDDCRAGMKISDVVKKHDLDWNDRSIREWLYSKCDAERRNRFKNPIYDSKFYENKAKEAGRKVCTRPYLRSVYPFDAGSKCCKPTNDGEECVNKSDYTAGVRDRQKRKGCLKDTKPATCPLEVQRVRCLKGPDGEYKWACQKPGHDDDDDNDDDDAYDED